MFTPKVEFFVWHSAKAALLPDSSLLSWRGILAQDGSRILVISALPILMEYLCCGMELVGVCPPNVMSLVTCGSQTQFRTWKKHNWETT